MERVGKSGYQLLAEGYSGDNLVLDKNCVVWGHAQIHIRDGGLDTTPEGVGEVRLLKAVHPDDRWMDGATIRLEGSILQRFLTNGKRAYIEQPLNDGGVAMGVSPDGASYMYISDQTCSLKTRKVGGSWAYGEGWVHGWVNMGRGTLKYLEWCIPKYEPDETSELVKDGEDVGAIMFWGLWRMLRNSTGI